MKCEGWSLGIDIAVGADKTGPVGAAGSGRAGGVTGGAGAGTAAGGGSGPGGGGGLHQSGQAGLKSDISGLLVRFFPPTTLPHVYIGQFQMQYIIDLVNMLANPSSVVRASRKLRMFYGPPRSQESRKGVVQMPLLKQKVEINLTADAFRVHHDAQDNPDPADLVYIDLSR